MMDQDFPYLTRWVTNPKTKNVAIGIPSVKAMGLNVTALEKLAEWYCPVQPIAKCVNINVMRREVGWLKHSCSQDVVIQTEPIHHHVSTKHPPFRWHSSGSLPARPKTKWPVTWMQAE